MNAKETFCQTISTEYLRDPQLLQSTQITTVKDNIGLPTYIFLPNEGERRRVCEAFFMCTLVVGESTVRYAAKKRTIGTSDRRGKHTPKNKIAEDDRNIIRAHIRGAYYKESQLLSYLNFLLYPLQKFGFILTFVMEIREN